METCLDFSLFLWLMTVTKTDQQKYLFIVQESIINRYFAFFRKDINRFSHLLFKVPIFEYSTTLPELSRQSVVALEEVNQKEKRDIKIFHQILFILF